MTRYLSDRVRFFKDAVIYQLFARLMIDFSKRVILDILYTILFLCSIFAFSKKSNIESEDVKLFCALDKRVRVCYNIFSESLSP